MISRKPQKIFLFCKKLRKKDFEDFKNFQKSSRTRIFTLEEDTIRNKKISEGFIINSEKQR